MIIIIILGSINIRIKLVFCLIMTIVYFMYKVIGHTSYLLYDLLYVVHCIYLGARCVFLANLPYETLENCKVGQLLSEAQSRSR